MSNRIVVTGAAGVLGRAVIELLHDRGADTIGVDLASSSDLPGHFIAGTDLTLPQGANRAMAEIAKGGPIAGLVNIAGGFAWETLDDGSAETWERMYRLNVATAVNASRAALDLLRDGGGAIVNVGAAATLKAGAGMGAYTAAKSGVARLTEALAEEMKDSAVRVNAVLPSIIDTPANRADMGEDNADRWVRPAELAEVIAFLLSPAASAVTGACIPVTGRV